MTFHTPWLGILPAAYNPSGPALVFADTETVGRGKYGSLRRPYLIDGRRIWDIALCRRNPDGSQEWLEAFVKLENLPFDLDDPDTRANLNRFGRFDERHPQITGPDKGRMVQVLWEQQLADDLMYMLRPTPGMDGMAAKPVLIGAVPSFEDLGLADLLHRTGRIDSEPPYHYHLWDIENVIAGRLRRRPHASSEDLSRLLGVNPDDYDRHTARGDVEWVMDQYDMVYAPLWRIWAARVAMARRIRRARASTPQTAVEGPVAA